jgi:hypothetical protein
MGNYSEKKVAAEVHNTQRETMQSMVPVGACLCGGTLYMYLKSEDSNIFNVYCTHNDCGVTDIRHPHDGDVYFKPGPKGVIDSLLVDAYGRDKIEALFEQESSTVVDNMKAKLITTEEQAAAR